VSQAAWSRMAASMKDETCKRGERREVARSRVFGLARWLVLCASLAVVAMASNVWAQDLAAAGQHFDAAQEAFAAGKFELAAREYQAAHDITKESTLLENIGESWQRAGRLPQALAAYKAYLAAAPQAANRTAIEERVKAIEAAMAEPAGKTGAGTQTETGTGTAAAGSQTAQTPSPAGSSKTDAPAPASSTGAATATTTPSATAPTGSTPATSPATSPQAAPAATTGTGGTADAAAASPAPKDTGPPITPPEPPPSKLRVVGWVSVASAVALLTGGAVIGLGAQSRADELRRRTTLLSGDRPLTYTEGEREAYSTLTSEGRTYNQTAIALFAVGGTVAATALTLFVVDFVRKPKASSEKKMTGLVRSSSASFGWNALGLVPSGASQ